MEAIKTFTHAGYNVQIHQDDDAQSPDTWGNEDLFLVTTRNRYFEVQRDGFTMDGCAAGEYKKDYHVLKLNAYIHSGVALSLGTRGQFSDPWDSGQIGFVLVKKRCGFRNIVKAAESLVSEWNSHLSGEVYGFVIEEEDGTDVDSCWGFVGDIKYCIDEAKMAAECAREHETAEVTRIAQVMAL